MLLQQNPRILQKPTLKHESRCRKMRAEAQAINMLLMIRINRHLPLLFTYLFMVNVRIVWGTNDDNDNIIDNSDDCHQQLISSMLIFNVIVGF